MLLLVLVLVLRQGNCLLTGQLLLSVLMLVLEVLEGLWCGT